MKLRDLFKRGETRDAGNDPSWRAMLGLSVNSGAGEHVDAKSAEGISAVFGCVQALSESTACLPLHVYQRSGDGQRERADDHALARALRDPNPYQSGLSFRESMTASVLLSGNAYARKEYNGSGEVSALYPLESRAVSVVKLPSGALAYDWSDTDGKRIRLLQDEVFHLRDRCDAGSYVGKSRITVARETLGVGLAMRAHGAATYRNGARPSGTLEPARALNPEQVTHVQKYLDERSGVIHSGRFLLLPHGMQFKPMSMSLEDAQWVEAQQFNTEEVCRIFRVPPTMVGDLRFGSYQNTAELGSQFVRYSLARWIAMWESEINRSLLGPIARRRYYAEHSVEGLLRGNPELRADFYQKAIGAGWMTVDEVRKLENLSPLEKSLEVE